MKGQSTPRGFRRGPLSRRQTLAAAAIPFLPMGAAHGAVSEAGPLFFSAKELALLEELTEIIIPTDEHSPGARAAGVARDLDRWMAETSPRIAEHRRLHAQWRAGLQSLRREARAQHGLDFLDLNVEQKRGLVALIAAAESAPATDDQRFFVALKAATSRSYYTSEIGIQQDLQYKGNSYFAEFQGHDVVPLKR